MDTPRTEIQNTIPPTPADPSLLVQFASSFFTKANLSIGWSFIWRFALVSSILSTLLFFILVLPFAAGRTSDFSQPNVAPAVALWLIFIIPITIFLYDRVGKRTIARRLNLKIKEFIGWGILWRAALTAWMVGMGGINVLYILVIPIILVGALFSRETAEPPCSFCSFDSAPHPFGARVYQFSLFGLGNLSYAFEIAGNGL